MRTHVTNDHSFKKHNIGIHFLLFLKWPVTLHPIDWFPLASTSLDICKYTDDFMEFPKKIFKYIPTIWCLIFFLLVFVQDLMRKRKTFLKLKFIDNIERSRCIIKKKLVAIKFFN